MHTHSSDPISVDTDEADEAALFRLAHNQSASIRDKAQALIETNFLRHGTTIASVGEWALLLAVIAGVRAAH